MQSVDGDGAAGPKAVALKVPTSLVYPTWRSVRPRRPALVRLSTAWACANTNKRPRLVKLGKQLFQKGGYRRGAGFARVGTFVW